MAYQVFARKYRPQTFAEIVGQEPVVRTLTNALRLGRIAQAYLFVGPRGTGKTSTARILAKALECANGPSAEFDPKEAICVEIAEGRCLDVLEIDGASNNGVEQVRDLRDNVRYAPAKGRFKIYIIDEVHMLSAAAFNALLKTLEEPPAHVKFIFATTEVHKLPATILSRCQRFDLRRIPEPLIRSHLAHICELEKVVAEPGALDAVARYAEGGLRDAESALDQAISFYGDRVSEADVLSLFGLTGFTPVAGLGRALAQGDVGTMLKAARELAAAGKDLGKLSQDLLAFFRNLVIYQVSPAALEGEISTPVAEPGAMPQTLPLPVGPIGRRGVGTWGVGTLIASEAALFGYLLFAYYYVGATDGPGWVLQPRPDLSVALPDTLLLVASSFVAWWGERGVLAQRRSQALWGFGGACLMGTVFALVQLYEWHTQHFGLGTSSYGSLYFLTTGLHLAHVAVGVLVLAAIFAWTALDYFSPRRSLSVSAGVLYWHFVDIVWLFVFTTYYLTPYLGFGA